MCLCRSANPQRINDVQVLCNRQGRNLSIDKHGFALVTFVSVFASPSSEGAPCNSAKSCRHSSSSSASSSSSTRTASAWYNYATRALATRRRTQGCFARKQYTLSSAIRVWHCQKWLTCPRGVLRNLRRRVHSPEGTTNAGSQTETTANLYSRSLPHHPPLPTRNLQRSVTTTGARTKEAVQLRRNSFQGELQP